MVTMTARLVVVVWMTASGGFWPGGELRGRAYPTLEACRADLKSIEQAMRDGLGFSGARVQCPGDPT